MSRCLRDSLVYAGASGAGAAGGGGDGDSRGGAMSEHTKMPWRTSDEREMNGAIWIGCDHPKVGFVSHAEVRSGCEEADELGSIEANATFIIRACNSHYELLAACKEANEAIERLMTEVCCYPDHDIGAAASGELARRSIRNAIRKAEEHP